MPTSSNRNGIAISVRNLAKRYQIGVKAERYRTIRESIVRVASAPFRRRSEQEKATYWALNDVSFDVNRGDVLGIIGRNGAGKTTLLKVLSRITEPTRGSADIYGRIGSLLEVGTGFHPELTGRENIYLNGAILGMRRTEIDRKLDEIIAFAEVERFVDTPVKRFSSGMYLRLAFAVAAHLEPEILIVDEVLAVGDAAFQQKCLGKMSEVAKQDRTVLFVSHNMAAVAHLCRKTLWLEKGTVRDLGRSAEVIREYLSAETATEASWQNPSPPTKAAGTQAARIACAGEYTTVIDFGSKFEIEVDYVLSEPVRNLSVFCRITDSFGNIVFESYDSDSPEWVGQTRPAGWYCSTCLVPAQLLRPGRYFLSVGSWVQDVMVFDRHQHILAFDISSVGYRFDSERFGVITPVLDWTIVRQAGRSGTSRPISSTEKWNVGAGSR